MKLVVIRLLFLEPLFRGMHPFGHHLTLSDTGTGIQ